MTEFKKNSLSKNISASNFRHFQENYFKIGIKTLYEEYCDVLKLLSSNELNIKIIHPAYNDNFLSNDINLEDFQGIVWSTRY